VKKLTRDDPAVQAYLGDLQNPYASVQMFPPDEPAVTGVDDAWRAEYRLLENPHALDYYSGRAETATAKTSHLAAAGKVSQSVSKAEFRARCRSIFVPYIPALEKGRLRRHHLDFIARNESRPGAIRGDLLRHLGKYDLSTVPGLTSKFNREEDMITEEKLAEIERAAGVRD